MGAEEVEVGMGGGNEVGGGGGEEVGGGLAQGGVQGLATVDRAQAVAVCSSCDRQANYI